MDAAAYHRPPVTHCPKRRRSQFSGRCKNNCRVQLLWWSNIRVSGPFRSHLPGKLLSIRVARPGKGIDFPALIASHLGNDVGRGAKAVYTQMQSVTGHNQGAVPNQPGTKQRRGLQVRVAFWNGKAEPFVRYRILRVAAVYLVAVKRASSQRFSRPVRQ